MKKNLFAFLALMALMVGFTACDDDDDDAPWGGAYVEVTVVNLLGVPQQGETVYMFKDIDPDESTNTARASRRVVTDDDGEAKFTLNFTDLDITESETRLYFAVYQRIGDDIIFKKGEQAITVRRNDEKKITITVPI